MSWRNNAIRFRTSLLLMAGVMFVGAVYLWVSSPALPEAVFARHDARVPMSGKAVRVQTARGGGEIRLELEGGEKGRTDCLAMSFVCEGEGAVIYAAILVIGGLMAAIYLFQPLATAISGSDMPAGPAREPLRAAAPLALAVIALALGFAGTAAVDLSMVAAPWATGGPFPPEASR